MKVPLTSIYDDLNFASDRLSTQIRTLTFGTLALDWLFLSGNKQVPILKIGGNGPLLAIAFLCVLTLLFDGAQYWSMYLSANSVRRKAEEHNHKEAEYDESSLARRFQQFCFWAKQVTAAIGTIGLLTLIALSVAALQ